MGLSHLLSSSSCFDIRSLSLKMDRVRKAEKFIALKKQSLDEFYSHCLDMSSFNLTFPSLIVVSPHPSNSVPVVDTFAERVQIHWETKYRGLIRKHASKVKLLRRAVSRFKIRDKNALALRDNKLLNFKSSIRCLNKKIGELTRKLSLSDGRGKQKDFVIQRLHARIEELEKKYLEAHDLIESASKTVFTSVDNNGHFLPEVNLCILRLSGGNVPDKSVGLVMETVARMLGTTISTLPSETTVRRMAVASGFIDRLFNHAPNMRMSRREAKMLMAKNHTIAWFDSLPPSKASEIYDQIMTTRICVDRQTREESKKLQQLVLQKAVENASEIAQKLEQQANKRCHYTSKIMEVGFWTNEAEMKKGLSQLNSNAAKCKALKDQLMLRKNVILQSAPSSNPRVFRLSANKKQLSCSELTCSLLTLINSDQLANNVKCSADEMYRGANILHSFKNEDGIMNEWEGSVVSVKYLGNGSRPIVHLEYEGYEQTYACSLDEFEDGVRNSLIKIIQ